VKRAWVTAAFDIGGALVCRDAEGCATGDVDGIV
jgi:hypothetical protein